MRHKCLNCQRDLDSVNRADNAGARAQMKWCSVECKRTYKNKRYYALHRDEIRARVARNKRKARMSARFDSTSAGYVYIVKCADLYKIGATRNAVQRIARFETSYPHDLRVIRIAQVADMKRVEKSLHTRFAQKRVKGEWFDLTASDLRVIARMLPRTESER